MLILPLHKKPTAENFPWVTLALIVANVFVFFFLQSGDAAVARRAAQFFRDSGLAQVEIPRYVAFIGDKREDLAQFLQTAPEPYRSDIGVQAIESDPAFLAALQADPPRNGGMIDADWLERRQRVDRIWAEGFTQRWEMHFGRFEPTNIFGAMFLHGGVGHLLGNMVFLAFLGLLVEGAFGPGLFLAVYLLGGFGGGALSALRHLHDTGAGLGASGAIAALMGAYGVVWGLRKVRFFWWFFIVFDYVKAPALILVPIWLGWELLNMWLNPSAHIGFDVHAGGIVTGALLAWGVRALRWERRAFLDEDEQRDAQGELLQSGLAALGKLEFARARTQLVPLAEQRPDDLTVLLPLFRSWRDRPQDPGFHQAAKRVLLHASSRREDVVEAQRVFEEYLKATDNRPQLAAEELLRLSRRWMSVGAHAQVDRMLALLGAQRPDLSGLPDAVLGLALAYRERGDVPAAQRLLRQLVERYPSSTPGTKAAFLLAQA